MNDMLYFIETEPVADMFKAPNLMADENWLYRQDNGLCPECLHVDRSRYPQPFDVVIESLPASLEEPHLKEIRQVSLFFANIPFTIWRRDFIDTLREEMSGMVIGQCVLPDGSEVSEYVTCYSKNYVILRGNRQSRYRICPRCGCNASEIHNSPWYLLSKDIQGGPIYQDSECRLYVDPEIQVRHPFLTKQFNISLVWTSVRDAPVDGQCLPDNEIDV
jgi:hypothetical protein